ncbi:MAG: Na(+)/H(+) antiporter subunit C [Acidimicrobiales bacterium]
MTLALAVAVGGLFAAGTYLLLQRNLTRILLGLGLFAHGANLLLLAAGGRAGAAPFIGGLREGEPVADPLPQALALTAIVISFGLTAFLLALAYRSWTLTGEDEVEDDPEDRRIAALAERERHPPRPPDHSPRSGAASAPDGAPPSAGASPGGEAS